MKNLEILTTALSEVMSNNEKMDWLIKKIASFEVELNELKRSKDGDWMSLAEAATLLKKTSDAVYQRIHHPKKPMPQGKVWKQDAKGCSIYVHLGNYKKFM